MNVTSFNPERTLRIAVARVHQSIGWSGMAGLVLIAIACAMGAAGWTSRTTSLMSENVPIAKPDRNVTTAVVRSVAKAKPGLRLPHRSDVPVLLTLIQQAAAENGLGWAAANYRITPATESEPTTLEVRCNFKGPYPKLRGMVAQLLTTVPALTLRELSLHRSNSDVADVDAKLVLAVFLTDDRSASSAQPKDVAP